MPAMYSWEMATRSPGRGGQAGGGGAAAGGGGATINIPSLDRATVQSYLDDAVEGDTFILPSGTSNWSSQLNVTLPANVTIRGAGSGSTRGGGDSTVIVDNYSANSPLIVFTVASTGTMRLERLTVKGGSGGLKDGGMIAIGGPGYIAWGNCHFDTQAYSPDQNNKVILVGGGVFGVIYECILDLDGTSAIYPYNGGQGSDAGDQTWTEATNFGGANFLFLEDSDVNGTPSSHDSRPFDGFTGARFVLRYCDLTACSGPEEHATGHSPDDRGTRAVEVYHNTFSKGVGQTEPNYMMTEVASGCALSWFNTVNTEAVKHIFLFNVTRKNNDTYGQTAPPNGWGYAGSDFSGSSSVWDGNTNSGTGYPCLDQPGRGAGQLLTGSHPNKLNDSTGTRAWPNQALEPIYIWGNVGSPSTEYSGSYYSNNTSTASGARVQADRDYYAQASGIQTSATSPFNGTTGTGWGTIANRPTTCTTGVGYWATDENKLYVATATNTWTLYYQPYTYPHPLRP